MWNEISQTLASEFSDLNDPSQATRVVLRLFLAAMLGGVLGLEREQSGQAAGVRTHMLVAVGAALFVLTPQLGGAGDERHEPGDSGHRGRSWLSLCRDYSEKW